MSKIKILGLAIMAMFAFSVVGASSASAAEWGLCKDVAGKTGEFEDSLCTKLTAVPGTGLYEFEKLTAAIPVHGKTVGKLKLTDMGAPGGASTIECEGTLEGSVGPGKEDSVTKTTTTSCVRVSGSCEAGHAITAEPLNLPWKTELLLEGGKVRDMIMNGGKGTPGWKVECTVLGFVKIQDECTGETTTGVSVVKEAEKHLVHFTFDGISNEKPANCSLGGEKQGLVEGLISILPNTGGGEGDILTVGPV